MTLRDRLIDEGLIRPAGVEALAPIPLHDRPMLELDDVGRLEAQRVNSQQTGAQPSGLADWHQQALARREAKRPSEPARVGFARIGIDALGQPKETK